MPRRHNYQMNIRVTVCLRRSRCRNRSRRLPVSLRALWAGCVRENVHLSLRFLLAMRYRAASASLRRPWEYNQRGDSGMNLKETSLKAVYSYRCTCRGGDDPPTLCMGSLATADSAVGLRSNLSGTEGRERGGYRRARQH